MPIRLAAVKKAEITVPAPDTIAIAIRNNVPTCVNANMPATIINAQITK
jgi:hypothetical protein